MTVERPRVRDLTGQELALPSWDGAVTEDWLGKWAMNLMLINVSTRKFRRAVRLPGGDVPAPTGDGVSKSAASRHFVALSAARMKEWMGDLSGLDIMVVQIDGIHGTIVLPTEADTTVLPTEADTTVLTSEEPTIGDRDVMGVTSRIFQHLLWSRKGKRTIRH